MLNTSVLIYSCDKYSDVWEPFFTLFFRYWECPFRVYIATESKKCFTPGITTINGLGTWTERMQNAVREIPTKYVIGMCEDMFFRRRVDEQTIRDCIKAMEEDETIASFNFEKEYDWVMPGKCSNFGLKPPGAHYRKTCQPTLWRRDILLELLDCNMSAWKWEMSGAPDEYKYYIWTGSEDELVFEYGYHDNKWFGIQKGRWVREDVVPLFQKEGIDVDYQKRGFV